MSVIQVLYTDQGTATYCIGNWAVRVESTLDCSPYPIANPQPSVLAALDLHTALPNYPVAGWGGTRLRNQQSKEKATDPSGCHLEKKVSMPKGSMFQAEASWVYACVYIYIYVYDIMYLYTYTYFGVVYLPLYKYQSTMYVQTTHVCAPVFVYAYCIRYAVYGIRLTYITYNASTMMQK